MKIIFTFLFIGLLSINNYAQTGCIPPDVYVSSNAPICAGNTLTLDVLQTFNSYAWAGPNAFSSVYKNPIVSVNATIAMSGTYTVTVTDANACSNTASVLVIVNALPIPTASNNSPVCEGQTISLIGHNDSINSEFGYIWTGPDSFLEGSQYTVIDNATKNMEGVYKLIVTDLNTGCNDSATTLVFVNSLPIVEASNNSPVCVGNPLNLIGNANGIIYDWSGPNSFTKNTLSPSVSNHAATSMAGTYKLIVTNAKNCKDSATTVVVINTLPFVMATNNSPVCVGYSLSLSGNANGISFIWKGPSGFTNNTASPQVSAHAAISMAGIYKLIVTNAYNCKDSTTTNVRINPLPIVSASSDTSICKGGLAFLTAKGASTYLWNNALTTANISVSPVISSTYTVTGTNVCGTASDNVIVNVSNCSDTIISQTALEYLSQSTMLSSTIDTCIFDFTKIIDSATIIGFDPIDTTNTTRIYWSYLQGGINKTFSNIIFSPSLLYGHWYTIYQTITCNNKNKSENSKTFVDAYYFMAEGIHQFNVNHNFSIYPNPAKNQLIINCNKLTSKALVTLTNTLGQVVLQQEISSQISELRLNIENLNNGIYFIRIGDAVQKFVKE